jgi:hypothetical protein
MRTSRTADLASILPELETLHVCLCGRDVHEQCLANGILIPWEESQMLGSARLIPASMQRETMGWFNFLTWSTHRALGTIRARTYEPAIHIPDDIDEDQGFGGAMMGYYSADVYNPLVDF